MIHVSGLIQKIFPNINLMLCLCMSGILWEENRPPKNTLKIDWLIAFRGNK